MNMGGHRNVLPCWEKAESLSVYAATVDLDSGLGLIDEERDEAGKRWSVLNMGLGSLMDATVAVCYADIV